MCEVLRTDGFNLYLAQCADIVAPSASVEDATLRHLPFHLYDIVKSRQLSQFQFSSDTQILLFLSTL